MDDMQIEQLYQGGYLLTGEVGGRPLHLVLLVDERKSLLLDTGCLSHVDDLILPALNQLCIPPSSLGFVVNTHCDFDHIGGNHSLKELAPQVVLGCGKADREQVESPEFLYRVRYDSYRDEGIFYNDAVRDWIMKNMGEPQPVDLTFVGGEKIELGPERELEIMHLPGHSHGHLGILDRSHRALFGGDSVHGAVYLDLTGKPALCPTYLYPAEYLETILKIESLDLDLYSGCHWPVKRGREIAAFCKESRAFVQLAEARILDALVHPKTLRELCDQVGPQLGRWAPEVNSDLCYAFRGHLDDLLSQGLIQNLSGTKPFRYQQRN